MEMGHRPSDRRVYELVFLFFFFVSFFFQAEDGIRDLVRSRGLGDVYKRQGVSSHNYFRRRKWQDAARDMLRRRSPGEKIAELTGSLLMAAFAASIPVSYTHLTLPTSDLV